MATIQISYAQIAQVGLATVNKAQISADDTSMALVNGLKEMLRGIASGALIVAPTPAGAEKSAQGNPAPAHPRPALKPPRRPYSPVPPHPKQDVGAGHVVAGPAPQQKLASGAARGGEGVVPAGAKIGPAGAKV